MQGGWRTATLAERVPERLSKVGPGPVRRVLEREAEGLHVDWEFSLVRNWLQVRARGEDVEAFLNLLGEKFGGVPVEHSKVEKWDVLRGFVTGAGKVGFGVYVDLGISEPVPKDALYPLHRMRAQLADGQQMSCRDILRENSLVDDFPVKVVVTEVEGEKVSVDLADETRELLLTWRSFPFDRIIAVGIERENVEAAVKSAQLHYDVIRIESLSSFVHCLVCKIGTDSPGVIAKIGHRLRGVVMASYRSKVKV